FSILYLAQALAAAGRSAAQRFAVITAHAQEVTGHETLCPEHAMAAAPSKVLAMEYPHIRARAIDVTLDEALPWLARTLAADLCAPWVEPVVAYRGRYRWAQSF